MGAMAGRGGAESNAGVEKGCSGGGGDGGVGGGGAVRGMVDNASCETEAPGPCAAQKTFKLIPPGLFQ